MSQHHYPVLRFYIHLELTNPPIAGPVGDPLFAGPVGDPLFAGPVGDPLFAGPVGDPLFSGPVGDPLFAGPVGDPLFAGPAEYHLLCVQDSPIFKYFVKYHNKGSGYMYNSLSLPNSHPSHHGLQWHQ